MARRHELTDAQWEQIKGLLPGKRGDPGRTAADNRLFVDAVLFVLKAGIPWEDLPERYGKHNSVRRRFDRWRAAGVWERPAETPGDPDLEELRLDSTTVKAHPAASTGRRLTRAEKEDAHDRRRLGRGRGGLSTKPPAAVDRRGRLVRLLLLAAGRRGDAPQADALLDGLARGAVGHVTADAGYDSDAIRRRVKRMRARACIKPNPTRKRKRKRRHDRRRYRHRDVVERFFGRVERCRRVATRDEKKPANFAGFVWLAAFVTDGG